MKEEVRNLVGELKNVRTVDLASVSRTILEKLFWIITGILGIGWAIYFLPNQFELWSNNPSIISLKDVPLSDIPYPSLSILPQRITKYTVAERLGNYLIPDKMHEKFKPIRELLFDYWAGVNYYEKYQDKILKNWFNEDCFEKGSDCKVSLNVYLRNTKVIFFFSFSNPVDKINHGICTGKWVGTE